MGRQRMRWLVSRTQPTHQFEQTAGDTIAPGSLACCTPWGHKESDTTQQLHNNSNNNASILGL